MGREAGGEGDFTGQGAKKRFRTRTYRHGVRIAATKKPAITGALRAFD